MKISNTNDLCHIKIKMNIYKKEDLSFIKIKNEY